MTVQLFRKNGEITIFLSLLLSSLFALLCISYESTRVQYVKFEKETAMDAGLRSCFGEYSKDLYDIYSLTYIDSSYKVSQASTDNIREHLEQYYVNNIDPGEGNVSADVLGIEVKEVTIPVILFSSDNRGIPVYYQAVEYMNKYGDPSHFSAVLNLRNQLPGTDADSILGDWDEALERVAAFGIDFVNPAELARGMVSNCVDHILSARGKSLSEIPYREIPSKRNLNKGNYGLLVVNEQESVFSEYLLQKCVSLQSNLSICLSCELEYLLNGKARDYENAEILLERLIRIFAKEYYAYVCSDGGKQDEMRTLADEIVPPCFTEPGFDMWFERELLIEAVVDSLECAWAQTEAICKVSRLLSGGRVKPNSPSENWILPLEMITEYRALLGSNGGSGNTYDEYVAAFFQEVPRDVITMRFLDIVEMNLRKLGNPGLCVDGCVEYIKAKVETESSFGYSYSIVRDYSYEKKYRENNS